MVFKKLADFFWPLGGTLLALLVMPLAIEQYPDFFKESRWPLPIAAVVVIACWLVPLLGHDRAKGIYWWTVAQGWAWRTTVCISVILFVVVMLWGSMRIFRFHTNHLNAVLRKKEIKAAVELLQLFPRSHRLPK